MAELLRFHPAEQGYQYHLNAEQYLSPTHSHNQEAKNLTLTIARIDTNIA
jgi:hypothetical protein